jgi:glycosyltransferase involved in cell wall biosynthesis
MVSIILPTYNGAKYIRQSVESCLKQTYADIELIIVNDCSTDETAKIIAEYADQDPRVRIITNETNKKLPASLNKGFEHANGDFFTWTSDDNIYSPLAIETLIKSIIADLQTDIAYSSYHFVDENGNNLDTFGHSPENLIFKCAPGACFLYKRKVHEQLNGYDETKFRMEDMDFWLRAATLFQYKYVNDPGLYYYRKHANNLTTAIHSSQDLYNDYRMNHLQSFRLFFNKGLDFYPSDQEIETHLELYFEDIIRNKNWDYTISDKITNYINYLDSLQSLDWEKTGFSSKVINDVIAEKKNRMVSLVLNDLIFENKKLQKKNPKIAAQLNKPLSWYYKEYEVLPGWYKKIGHFIKAMQGNRSFRSLLTKEGRQ